MKRRLTTCPVSASWVWMVNAPVDTSTVCCVPATFIVRFTVTFWLTSSLTPFCTVLLKPVDSADTEYIPGGTERNR